MPVTPDPQTTNVTFWEVAIAGATLVMSFIISAISGTWILGKSRQKLVEKIDEVKLELERKINEDTETAVHDFGETVSAIRTKINEVELWNRDNFVSKSTFNTVQDQWRVWFTRFEDKIDKRFDQIDAKLSKKE
jgi:hypothetical protein